MKVCDENQDDLMSPGRDGERDPVVTEPKYNPKVLVGNWFDKRLTYEPATLCHKSVYTEDYCEPYPPHKRDKSFLLDRIIQHQGQMGKVYMTDGDIYKGNYATTYDLCFNHLPRGLDGPRIRTYRKVFQSWTPQQDLLQCYGNITQFGLREYKQEDKRFLTEQQGYIASEYRDKYGTPCWKFPATQRMAKPRIFSSALYVVNKVNKDVRVRGEWLRVVPDIPPEKVEKPAYYY